MPDHNEQEASGEKHLCAGSVRLKGSLLNAKWHQEDKKHGPANEKKLKK